MWSGLQGLLQDIVNFVISWMLYHAFSGNNWLYCFGLQKEEVILLCDQKERNTKLTCIPDKWMFPMEVTRN